MKADSKTRSISVSKNRIIISVLAIVVSVLFLCAIAIAEEASLKQAASIIPLPQNVANREDGENANSDASKFALNDGHILSGEPEAAAGSVPRPEALNTHTEGESDSAPAQQFCGDWYSEGDSLSNNVSDYSIDASYEQRNSTEDFISAQPFTAAGLALVTVLGSVLLGLLLCCRD